MIDKKIFVIVQINFEFSRCDQKNAKIPAGSNPAQTFTVIRANFTAITVKARTITISAAKQNSLKSYTVTVKTILC